MRTQWGAMPCKSADRFDMRLAPHTRMSGTEIALHLVHADYGSAKIDAMGFAGEYSPNDILFASVSFNWKLARHRH